MLISVLAIALLSRMSTFPGTADWIVNYFFCDNSVLLSVVLSGIIEHFVLTGLSQ